MPTGRGCCSTASLASNVTAQRVCSLDLMQRLRQALHSHVLGSGGGLNADPRIDHAVGLLAVHDSKLFNQMIIFLDFAA